jgi:hypothetical protein
MIFSLAHSKHKFLTFCVNDLIHEYSADSTSIFIKSGIPYISINLSKVIVFVNICL